MQWQRVSELSKLSSILASLRGSVQKQEKKLGAYEWELDPLDDGTLFVHQHRVTWTCYLNSQVTSVHFDKNQGEIFYQGHNIKEIALGPLEQRLLERLSLHMSREGLGQEMVEAYLKSLYQA